MASTAGRLAVESNKILPKQETVATDYSVRRTENRFRRAGQQINTATRDGGSWKQASGDGHGGGRSPAQCLPVATPTLATTRPKRPKNSPSSTQAKLKSLHRGRCLLLGRARYMAMGHM